MVPMCALLPSGFSLIPSCHIELKGKTRDCPWARCSQCCLVCIIPGIMSLDAVLKSMFSFVHDSWPGFCFNEQRK